MSLFTTPALYLYGKLPFLPHSLYIPMNALILKYLYIVFFSMTTMGISTTSQETSSWKWLSLKFATLGILCRLKCQCRCHRLWNSGFSCWASRVTSGLVAGRMWTAGRTLCTTDLKPRIAKAKTQFSFLRRNIMLSAISQIERSAEFISRQHIRNYSRRRKLYPYPTTI